MIPLITILMCQNIPLTIPTLAPNACYFFSFLFSTSKLSCAICEDSQNINLLIDSYLGFKHIYLKTIRLTSCRDQNLLVLEYSLKTRILA